MSRREPESAPMPRWIWGSSSITLKSVPARDRRCGDNSPPSLGLGDKAATSSPRLGKQGKDMNTLILWISRFLSIALNWGILILAIAEVFLMVKSYTERKALKLRIEKLNDSTAGRQVLPEKKDGRLQTEEQVTIERDWREFDTFCDDYQNKSVLFSWVSLIIQIFPLLGILGTVTGLFVAMNGNADWSNAQALFEGVQFALSSTVLGILCAVIFKVADIAFSARYLNYIDDGIDRFRENYNVEKELPLGGDAS